LTLALREQEVTGQQLSPAGLAYQRAWDRVQRLQSQLVDLEVAAQAHQAAMAHLLHPWRAAYRSHLQAVVQALGAAVSGGVLGLSSTQRRTAQTALQAHTEALHALDGQAPPPGGDPSEGGSDAGTEPDDDANRRAARQAKRDKRAARRQVTPAGQAEAQAQQGAETTLRGLYRQLASALHPDREPEGPARDRKNALMGEANAAYQRQDLVTLLRLQHTALAEHPAPPDTATEQRLQHLARLLQQQAADLDRQRQAAQQRWWAVLHLHHGTPLTATHLASVWARAQTDKMANEAAMAEELAQLQRPNTLKGWLNGWLERQTG